MHGGAEFVPLSVPHVGGNELKYVKECFDTGWVSSVGSFVSRFEKSVARWTGSGHAIAVSSGTAAIHTALLIADVGPDDEVLMPSLTFIAPANAVRYRGAWPVFLDSEPVYWQLDPSKLDDFLRRECVRSEGGTRNRGSGRRVKAILPVHVLGHPCEMDSICAIAAEWDLVVIEDATESLGSRHRDRSTGAIGRLGCFSFNGNKIITTGGGGMITTNDPVLAERAQYFTTQAKDDPVEFVHGAVGYNYRLTNIQAAMGCAQMELLPDFLETKRRIAARYAQALGSATGLTIPSEAPWARSNWWLYTIRIDAARFGEGSRDALARLQAAGIQTRPFWQPMHLSPAHRHCQAGDCTVAESLYRDCLSLPCSTNLSAAAQERVISALLPSSVPISS